MSQYPIVGIEPGSRQHYAAITIPVGDGDKLPEQRRSGDARYNYPLQEKREQGLASILILRLSRSTIFLQEIPVHGCRVSSQDLIAEFLHSGFSGPFAKTPAKTGISLQLDNVA